MTSQSPRENTEEVQSAFNNLPFRPDKEKPTSSNMPKKRRKSGKAGKLARMTEEDRILYLEQQRLAEEEMRKKKEDMLTQFLKVDLLGREFMLFHSHPVPFAFGIDIWICFSFTTLCVLQDKLSKEEKATKFNLNKLNHQWRNIMREAKSKELKKDIEILSQTFERIVDRKDSVIKSLAKDLEEAEEQYAMALRSHLQNVDSAIGKLQNVACTHSKSERFFSCFKVCVDSQHVFLRSVQICNRSALPH